MCYLFYGILYPQGGGDPDAVENELNIQISNVPNSTITFELIPLGANWANTRAACSYILYNDVTTRISSITAGSNGYDDCLFNGYDYRYSNEGNERDVRPFSCAQSTAGLLPIRNGFYRLNVKENGQLLTYVYFDWRDAGFPHGSCHSCTLGLGNDMTIRYYGLPENLYFWNTNNITNDRDDPDAQYVIGDIITWADWKCSSGDSSPFPWSQGLVLTTEVNNPRITWGPHLTFQATHIKVYRAASITPLSKPALSASLIATVSSSTL
ncbi:MAG: hypothetical protein IIC76_00600 [Bacteroidetes bacterium]|nr:hypothetical protein [Bacteroidota bacterium]